MMSHEAAPEAMSNFEGIIVHLVYNSTMAKGEDEVYALLFLVAKRPCKSLCKRGAFISITVLSLMFSLLEIPRFSHIFLQDHPSIGPYLEDWCHTSTCTY